MNPDLDAVITDYAVPDRNRLELTKQLPVKSSQLPIILATGYADVGNIQERQVWRLKKPFTQELLQVFVFEAVPAAAEHA